MFDRTRTRDNLREAAFILICIMLAYLIAALATYHESDPSFSATDAPAAARNAGGIFGAHLSSLLLELFGRSSYLLCLIMFVFCWVLLRSNEKDNINHVSGWLSVLGVLMFMTSASSLEYLRFHHNAGVPAGAGGVVGRLVAPLMVEWFGAFGASLLLLGIWLLSFSLSAGLSWFAFLEAIGAMTEKFLAFVVKTIPRWLSAAPREAKEQPAGGVGGVAIPARAQIQTPVEPQIQRQKPQRATAITKPPVAPVKKPAAAVKDDARDNAAAGDDVAGAGDSGDDAAAGAGNDEPSKKPELGLLEQPAGDTGVDESLITRTSQLIEQGLLDFNIKATVVAAHPGPVVTRYDIQPATGVKGAQVVSLSRDLARTLSVDSIRVLENISGTNYIGLEIPNKKRAVVALYEILSSAEYTDTAAALPLALGKTASGNVAVADLATMPHLLVAGATGAGKSVFINAILLSLLYSRSPDELRMLLIDPKMLELSAYADIPHLLAPVVTDMALAPVALQWAVEEMEARYRRMATTGARHIESYNELARAGKVRDDDGQALPALPYIAVIIDELADLMMVAGKKVEVFISRLAQKARAAGIHIVLATQRPSVDVITGLIKANVPCRLSFQVASKIDSRTILDQMGAETLLGKGDMLYMPSGSGIPRRLHGAFVSDSEVQRVVGHVREQSRKRAVEYLADFNEMLSSGAAAGGNGGGNGDGEDAGAGENDPLYDKAVAALVEANRVSISLVQRKLRIGYNRAARLVEAMESAGLVTPMNDLGARKLIKRQDS